jgi:lipoate-protein ligase A
MVRRIDVTGETVGYWSAMDELMAKQMYAGTLEPTVVVMHWDEDTPSLDLGTYEDAARLDVDLAREEGFAVGRRYAFAGGTAVHTPDFPNYMLYYRREDTDIVTEADSSGHANVAALQEIGLEAEYDSIGDIEIIKEEMKVKVMAGSAATFHHPDLWVSTDSVIWDFPPEGQILDDALSVPPEKFEDKDTDTLTGRMQPLSEVLEELGVDATREAVIDELVAKNVEATIGEDAEIVRSEWTDEEESYIQQLAPFFESDPWINRVSSTRMCRRVDPDFEFGQAAYKARKLVNVSVVLDDTGAIQDIVISGDMYVRPQPTATRSGILETLEGKLRGEDPTDEAALVATIEEVLARSNHEAPGIDPEHIASPLSRAAANTVPVREHLAEVER